MARIPRINLYNTDRIDTSKQEADFQTLKFENNKGEVMVVKPQEVKDVLHLFIDNELSSLGDDIKIRLKEKFEFRIKQVEISLQQHIEQKLLNTTERIIEKTIDRIIEEEVNKRVLQKLEKIKKNL
jgi:hypothetical protein